jgi:hypothetical protein
LTWCWLSSICLDGRSGAPEIEHNLDDMVKRATDDDLRGYSQHFADKWREKVARAETADEAEYRTLEFELRLGVQSIALHINARRLAPSNWI